MATIIQARPSLTVTGPEDIVEGPIPSPFPTNVSPSIHTVDAVLPPLTRQPFLNVVGPSGNGQTQRPLLASLTAAQRSCLIALNALIAPYSSSWRPISPGSSSRPLTLLSALRTLLSNFPQSTYTLPDSANEASLLVELGKRIVTLADSGLLSSEDGYLSFALISFLSYSNRVFLLSYEEGMREQSIFDPWVEPENIFESLYEDLLTLRSKRAAERISSSYDSPVTAVERDVAWSGIDENMNLLLAVRMTGRASMQSYPESEILPEYDSEPPSYAPSTSLDKGIPARHTHTSPSLHRSSIQSTSSEKLHMDLENVTSAIDRLYSLAPQIHSQRVELHPAKQEELEFAQLSGTVLKMADRLDHQRADRVESTVSPRQTSLKGKAKAVDAEDLDGLMDLIGRSQRTRMPEQRVAIPGNVKAPARAVALDTRFVAEYQENLGAVQVCVEVGEFVDLLHWSAIVLPRVTGTSNQLTLRREGHDIANIDLPMSVPSCPVEVTVQGHLEMKIPAPRTAFPPSRDSESPSLLDAAHLTTMSPTSFLCSSCTLPLIHPAIDTLTYTDLPSEHWAELVESWMCHSDQKLSGSVSKRARSGFWPSRWQALVGGSYLLFHQNSVVESNVRIATPMKSDMWCRVQCLCGANVGGCRCPSGDDTRIYRFAKYSALPITPSSPAVRLPLSAFVVSDMLEFMHAHATYRFAIRDQEDEKIRIFIWLFNPSLLLTSGLLNKYAEQDPSVVHAAKVLFKLVAPTENVDLANLRTTHPDFAQAEHLAYPLDVCNSLAAVLRKSNMAYPSSRRTLNGLDMGWLQRD